MTARTHSIANKFRKRLLYGRRLGRPLRPRQREALDTLLPLLSLPPSGKIDPRALFGAAAQEFWLEVGSGSGEHAIFQAKQNLHIGLIACEPYLNGMASLLSKIERDVISNIRVHMGDARDIVERLKENSLSRAFVLFPDPWPKKRHWKRRFISQENLGSLACAMKKGAELRVATDSMDYCAWTLEAISRSAKFEWLAESPSGWRARSPDWPETRYEAKAKSAGRACVYLGFQRL